MLIILIIIIQPIVIDTKIDAFVDNIFQIKILYVVYKYKMYKIMFIHQISYTIFQLIRCK
jgi:hypothetical protein